MKFAEIWSPRRQKIELTFPKKTRSKTLKMNPTGPFEIGSKKNQQSEANDKYEVFFYQNIKYNL